MTDNISKANFYPLERLEADDLSGLVNIVLYNFSAVVNSFLSEGQYITPKPITMGWSGTVLTIRLNSPLIGKDTFGNVLITKGTNVDYNGEVINNTVNINFAGLNSGHYIIYCYPTIYEVNRPRFFIDVNTLTVFSQPQVVREFTTLAFDYILSDEPPFIEWQNVVKFLQANNISGIPVAIVYWNGTSGLNVNYTPSSQMDLFFYNDLLRDVDTFTPGVIWGLYYDYSGTSFTITEGAVAAAGKIIPVPQQTLDLSFIGLRYWYLAVDKDGTIKKYDSLPANQKQVDLENIDNPYYVLLYCVKVSGNVIQEITDLRKRPFPTQWSFSNSMRPYEIGLISTSNSGDYFYMLFNGQGLHLSPDNRTFVIDYASGQSAFCVLSTRDSFYIYHLNIGGVKFRQTFDLYNDALVRIGGGSSVTLNSNYIISGLKASGSRLDYPVISGAAITNSSITSVTISDSSLTGTLSGTGTISGVKLRDNTLSGTITNVGTITGGTISNATLNNCKLSGTTSGADANTTISGIKLVNNTITGATINGGNINNATISGSTLKGTISGGAVGTNITNVILDTCIVEDSCSIDRAYFRGILSGVTISGSYAHFIFRSGFLSNNISLISGGSYFQFNGPITPFPASIFLIQLDVETNSSTTKNIQIGVVVGNGVEFDDRCYNYVHGHQTNSYTFLVQLPIGSKFHIGAFETNGDFPTFISGTRIRIIQLT